MKQILSKLFIILICLSLTVLSGCSQNSNTNLLNYPKLRWGMDVDEVIEALGLADSDSTYTPSKAGAETGGYLKVYSTEAFGSIAENIIFHFNEPAFNSSQLPGLSTIMILYPEDCNMSDVKQSLQQEFGASDQILTVYPLNKINDSTTELPYVEYIADDDNCYWISNVHISDYLGEDATAQYIDDYSIGQNIPKPLYSQYVSACPVTSIHWASNYGNDFNTSEHKNFVYFSSRCAQLDRFLDNLAE